MATLKDTIELIIKVHKVWAVVYDTGGSGKVKGHLFAAVNLLTEQMQTFPGWEEWRIDFPGERAVPPGGVEA